MEVRTYGQYCPVARATEILAMRWTPIIVRNLLLGCETFGELQEGAPGISRTLLSRRLVIRFELRDGPKRRIWVVLCPPDNEVCVKPPGYDEDLVVETDSEWLAKWHMGRISLGQAIHDGLISVQGPSHLVQALSGLGLSRFAGVAPA